MLTIFEADTMIQQQSKRIESVDILRGIVMMLMALDHVRDYFHIGANTGDPLDLASASPLLFFTRWITHLCAPIFIFLSGTSVFLQGKRKTQKELGLFVIKRGCWLIVAEWTIIAFGWTFNPAFVFIPFQVIWAIGISMVILGLLLMLRLPYTAMLATGLVIVCGHNMLDAIEYAPGFESSFWWDITHRGSFKFYPITENHTAILVYPFVPWTGLMLLGYSAGKIFTQFDPEMRNKILLRTGFGLLLFFALLRYSNLYGDPVPWSTQPSVLYTLFSFVKVQKYPPSLAYLSLTISAALILLAWLEGSIHTLFSRVMTVFGRTAFFYYILHIYLIHLLAAIVFFYADIRLQMLLRQVNNFLFYS